MKFIVKNIQGVVNKKSKSVNIQDELQLGDKLYITKDSSITISTQEDEFVIMEDEFIINECMNSEIFNVDFNFFNVEDGFVRQVLKNADVNKVINEKYQQESLMEIIKQRDNNTLQDPIFQEALQKLKENTDTSLKYKTSNFIRQKEETNVLSIKQIQKIMKEQQNIKCDIDDIDAIKNHISNMQNYRQEQDIKLTDIESEAIKPPQYTNIDQKVLNENIKEKITNITNINKANKHLSSTELKELLGGFDIGILSGKDINEMLDLTSLKMSEEDIIEAAKKINTQNYTYEIPTDTTYQTKKDTPSKEQIIDVFTPKTIEGVASKINIKNNYEISSVEPKYSEEIPLSKKSIPSQELHKILGEYDTSIFYNTIGNMINDGFIGMNEDDVLSLARQMHTSSDVSLHSLHNEETEEQTINVHQGIDDKLSKVHKEQNNTNSNFATIKQVKQEEEQLKENLAVKQAMARQEFEISKTNTELKTQNDLDIKSVSNQANLKNNTIKPNEISITNIIKYDLLSDGIVLKIQDSMDFANRKDWFF